MRVRGRGWPPPPPAAFGRGRAARSSAAAAAAAAAGRAAKPPCSRSGPTAPAPPSPAEGTAGAPQGSQRCGTTTPAGPRTPLPPPQMKTSAWGPLGQSRTATSKPPPAEPPGCQQASSSIRAGLACRAAPGCCCGGLGCQLRLVGRNHLPPQLLGAPQLGVRLSAPLGLQLLLGRTVGGGGGVGWGQWGGQLLGT
jgi:hypothetical protein